MAKQKNSKVWKAPDSGGGWAKRLEIDLPILDTGKTPRTYYFGSVKVTGQVPSIEVVTRNVTSGRWAMARAKDAFVKSGVFLPVKKDVPRYSVDADNPSILIRELNGKVHRGKFVNGKFKAGR